MRRVFASSLFVVLVAMLVAAVAGWVPGAGAAKAPRKGKSVTKRLGRSPVVPPNTRGLRELRDLRTRTSRTYVRPGGGRVARISAASLHFKNRRGRWQPIDSRLRRSKSRFLNRANRYSTALPADIAKGAVRVRQGRWWLGFRLRGARGRARVRGATARYLEALPGVDAAYRAEADAVKETLRLKGPESTRRFAFDLKMTRGLRPRVLRSGALVLRDRRGRVRLAVAAPYMFDRRGRRSQRVRYRLRRVGRGWRLAMVPSRRWLDARTRAWPVTVDPYVWVRDDGDCHLDSAQPDTSVCASTGLKVGTSGTSTNQALLHFDVNAAIPAGADVLSAQMLLYQNAQANNNTMKLEAFALDQDWTGAATWNRSDGTDRWPEPGGELDADLKAEENQTSAVMPAGGEWWGWHVRKMVDQWANDRHANHGVLIKGDNAANLITFQSSEFNNGQTGFQADGRPHLDVQYLPRVGERRGWRFEEQRLSDRLTLKVNVANGNLLLRQTDFRMPGGLGPDVTIGRTYNSQQEDQLAFGQGWNLDTGHDVRLRIRSNNSIRYMGPSGFAAVFTAKEGAPNEFVTPPGFNATLKRIEFGEYLLTDHQSQSKMRFTQGGRLLHYEDRNGRKVTLTYNTTDQWTTSFLVTAIKDAHSDSASDQVGFQYASGTTRIATMTDPASRTYQYGYDANGRLTTYTDPDAGVTRYDYDAASGLITKVTTPGGRITKIAYHPGTRAHEYRVKSITRVTNTTDLTGPTTSFEYNLRADGSGSTRVTDPIGTASAHENDRVTRYEFDDQSRVVKTRDALGRETSTKLTSNSNVETYTKASNTGTTPSTSFTYDSATDMLTGTTTPAGNGKSLTSKLTYSTPGTVAGGQYLPSQSDDENGTTTQFGYDTSGNVETMRDGLSIDHTVRFNYNATEKGRLDSITDAKGNVTSYGYDAKGNVNKVTPPTVNPVAGVQPGATNMTYHSGLARIEKVVDGKGQKRYLTYDALDRVTKVELFSTTNDRPNAADDWVAFQYDKDGNLTGRTEKDATRNASYTYDNLNRLTNEALPFSRSNAYTYDRASNLRTLTDGGGKVEYAYNALNQNTAVYEPGVSKPVRLRYDKDGRTTATRFPNGVTMDAAYDDADRVLSITSGKAGVSPLQKFRYAYDVTSPVARETRLRTAMFDDVDGEKTTYAYDALARLDVAKTTRNSDGVTLAQYDYDVDGNGNRTKLVTSGSAIANGTWTYSYNQANQLVQRVRPSGTHNYAYDANAQQTTDNVSVGLTYNLRDQSTAITGNPQDFLGLGQSERIKDNTVTLHHNVLGLGWRSAGTVTQYFTRDEDGTPLSQRGTAAGYYLRDALGSITGLTDAAGTLTHKHKYDPYGNVTASTGNELHLRFAGGYQGTAGLIHFGERFYNPDIGRWTQPDPLDQTGDLREGNRYVYAGADPVNMTDRHGTHSWYFWEGVTQAEERAIRTWYYTSRVFCYGAGVYGTAKAMRVTYIVTKYGSQVIRRAPVSAALAGLYCASFGFGSTFGD
jgi:RHS repeat-associated protein